MELELAPDFKELLKLLNENQVKYLLIGGYAVVLHGYVRNTNDIDLVIGDDLENARRLIQVLEEFGFGESLPADLFTKKNSFVRMGVEPIKIEILNYLAGVDFEEAYRRRWMVKVEDIEIPLIGLDDLIANKQAVGRLRDISDIEELKKRNR